MSYPPKDLTPILRALRANPEGIRVGDAAEIMQVCKQRARALLGKHPGIATVGGNVQARWCLVENLAIAEADLKRRLTETRKRGRNRRNELRRERVIEKQIAVMPAEKKLPRPPASVWEFASMGAE